MKLRVGRFVVQIPDKNDYCSELGIDSRSTRCFIEYTKLVVFAYNYACRVYLLRDCRASEMPLTNGLAFTKDYLRTAVKELNTAIRLNGYEAVLANYIRYIRVSPREST